jgi:hypothetical protein
MRHKQESNQVDGCRLSGVHEQAQWVNLDSFGVMTALASSDLLSLMRRI